MIVTRHNKRTSLLWTRFNYKCKSFIVRTLEIQKPTTETKKGTWPAFNKFHDLGKTSPVYSFFTYEYNQGTLTEGESSVRLTTFYLLFYISCFWYWKYNFLFYKTSNLNEVNCIAPYTSVSVPCHNTWAASRWTGKPAAILIQPNLPHGPLNLLPYPLPGLPLCSLTNQPNLACFITRKTKGGTITVPLTSCLTGLD
jgi:hypothetical protein